VRRFNGGKNTGLDKYNATVYNSNDFFGGALKKNYLHTLKIEQLSCLMTPDLLEILLVLPCTGIQHRQFIIQRITIQ
jgi:hypothetical protein